MKIYFRKFVTFLYIWQGNIWTLPQYFKLRRGANINIQFDKCISKKGGRGGRQSQKVPELPERIQKQLPEVQVSIEWVLYRGQET